MASGYTPRWKRMLIKFVPVLFQRCGDGNYHWRWDRLCYCRCRHHEGDEWHGGIQDLKTGEELVPMRLAINPHTEESRHYPEGSDLPSGWRWF